MNAPAGFEVSTTNGGGFGPSVALTAVAGGVAPTAVYVRFVPMAIQAYAANITHASSGATTVSKPVSGTGRGPILLPNGTLYRFK